MSRISPADPEPPKPVQQADRLLHYPAVRVQPGPMFRATAGDHGGNALLAYLPTVPVMIVAPVGVDRIRQPAGATAAAADRRGRLDQRHELNDVVAVAAGQRHLQRDRAPFGDHAVIGARPGTVDRARPRFPGRPSPPARVSFRSRPWTSPAPRRHLARPAAPRAAAARSRLVPVPQPPLARHPRPEAQLLRQELPRDPCVQHEQDAAQHRPFTARRAAAARSGPIVRPGRSTMAVDPSARAISTITGTPLFPHAILLGVLCGLHQLPAAPHAAVLGQTRTANSNHAVWAGNAHLPTPTSGCGSRSRLVLVQVRA